LIDHTVIKTIRLACILVHFNNGSLPRPRELSIITISERSERQLRVLLTASHSFHLMVEGIT
jgi:hypothetical protein